MCAYVCVCMRSNVCACVYIYIYKYVCMYVRAYVLDLFCCGRDRLNTHTHTQAITPPNANTSNKTPTARTHAPPHGK